MSKWFSIESTDRVKMDRFQRNRKSTKSVCVLNVKWSWIYGIHLTVKISFCHNKSMFLYYLFLTMTILCCTFGANITYIIKYKRRIIHFFCFYLFAKIWNIYIFTLYNIYIKKNAFSQKERNKQLLVSIHYSNYAWSIFWGVLLLYFSKFFLTIFLSVVDK